MTYSKQQKKFILDIARRTKKQGLNPEKTQPPESSKLHKIFWDEYNRYQPRSTH